MFKISMNVLTVNVTAMGTATTQSDHSIAPATKVILVMDLTALVIIHGGQIRRSGYRVTLMLMKMHQLALLTISPVGQ